MNRKNLILGGVLIVLVAAAYLYRGPIRQWRTELSKPKNFLANLKLDQVDKIEINKRGKTTKLEKANEKWKIGGTGDFYLKKDTADSMMARLKEAKEAVVELVGENKDKKSKFQTDNEKGIDVKLKQGNRELADFIVGKLADDFTSTYISRPNSSRTYLVKVNLNGIFSRSDWYDRTIFSSDKDKITQIRFQYPAREFTIAKASSSQEWTGIFPYSFRVDKNKIGAVLDIMSNLTSVKIPDQTFAGTGLEKHLIIVQATGEGIDNTLMVGGQSKEGEYYYAKKGDSDNIYLITAKQRDELNKRIWDLR